MPRAFHPTGPASSLTCTRHCPSPLPSRRAGAVEAAAAQHSRVGGLQHPGRSNGGAHHPPLPSVTAPACVLPRQLPPTACQPAAPHCTDVALLPAGQPAQPCMYRLSSLRCSPAHAGSARQHACQLGRLPCALHPLRWPFPNHRKRTAMLIASRLAFVFHLLACRVGGDVPLRRSPARDLAPPFHYNCHNQRHVCPCAPPKTNPVSQHHVPTCCLAGSH